MSDQKPPVSPTSFFHEESNDLKVRQVKLVDFLNNHGYGKAYIESEMSSSLVRVEDGIVQRTSQERIQDFVMERVRRMSEDALRDGYSTADFRDVLVRGRNVYFGDNLLRSLPSIELDFNCDTQDEAFFYFRNGFVHVTADGYEPRPYEELQGAIWEDQIVDREFEQMDPVAASEGSEWFEFLHNAMGQNDDRVKALSSALGYLLHGYKDPAEAKAVIFMDEAVSDVPSGRTGKSLVAEGLQMIVPVQRIDARNFSFGGQFSFQSIGIEDQVIDFNDASKGFDFERLFSVLTDDMQVERKYQDEVTIPFEDSPKFLLSTNHVIEGEGSSFEDRVFQIEFAPHYGKELTPVDEFGHRLFEEWDREQWRCFDNLMMFFVQRYLREGLQRYRHANLKKRKLRQETNPEFAEWILEQDSGWRNKKDLWKAFRAEYGIEREDLSQKQFTRWCNQYGKIYTGGELKTKKSGAKRSIELPELESE